MSIFTEAPTETQVCRSVLATVRQELAQWPVWAQFPIAVFLILTGLAWVTLAVAVVVMLMGAK